MGAKNMKKRILLVSLLFSYVSGIDAMDGRVTLKKNGCLGFGVNAQERIVDIAAEHGHLDKGSLVKSFFFDKNGEVCSIKILSEYFRDIKKQNYIKGKTKIYQRRDPFGKELEFLVCHLKNTIL